MVAGRKNAEIFLSLETVRIHVSNIFRKPRVADRASSGHPGPRGGPRGA